MKNKTLILVILFLLTFLFAINSKYNEIKLRNKLEKITLENSKVTDSVLIEKEIPNIDSLLIKGDYKNALDAYQEQFEIITDNHKEIVKFRIDIANQFINLSEQQHKKNTHNQNLSSKKQATRINKKSISPVHYLTATTTKVSEKEPTIEESSKNQYLTFESLKKHKLHYVGEVNNGKANGTGTAIFDTGGRYEGQWRDNLRDGKGTFYWTDGQYYDGEYKNDLRNGTGTYYWPNGEKYIGQWKKDKRHGEGTFYYKNGKIVKGIWKKDKLVEQKKTS